MVYALIFTIFGHAVEIDTYRTQQACDAARKDFVAFNFPIDAVSKSTIGCGVRHADDR